MNGQARSRDRRNLILFATGEGFWGLGTGLVASGTVLTVLLRDLGAGELMIGMIGAVEGMALLLPQVAGNYVFTSRRHLKRHLVHWHIFIIVPFLFAMAALLLLADRIAAVWLRWALLGLWGCFNFTIGVAAASWIDWVGQIFAARSRGLAVGITLATSALASTFSAMLAAKFIMIDPAVTGYARHYGLAGLITCGAMTVFYLVNDPGSEAAGVPRRGWRFLQESLRSSLDDANFRAYLAVRVLGILGFAMMPFVTMQFGRPDAGAVSSAFIVGCGALQALCVALTQVVIGAWGDRRGHREGLLTGLCLQVAALLVVLGMPGRVGCLLAFALAGAAIGGMTISCYNLNLEICRHENRVVHLNVTNLLLAVPSLVGPLVYGLIARNLALRAVFICGGVLSVLALIVLLRTFAEPRRYVVARDR